MGRGGGQKKESRSSGEGGEGRQPAVCVGSALQCDAVWMILLEQRGVGARKDVIGEACFFSTSVVAGSSTSLPPNNKDGRFWFCLLTEI